MMPNVFQHTDRARRAIGECLERMGLQPQEHAYSPVFEDTGVRLRRYAAERAAQQALLIVPAPIKRPYIWDLVPHVSVVGHALRRGFDVFLAEWMEAPDHFGLEAYTNIVAHCVGQIEAMSGRLPHLATHSLGGILCALHAARDPARLASLTMIETPLHFAEASGAFAPLLAFGPPGAAIVRHFGSVPGSFLNVVGMAASPLEFAVQRYADFFASIFDREDLRTHLLVLRWTMDEFPLPGRLYTEVVDDLYRGDRLMRGALTIRGKPVGPGDIAAPLAVVLNPGSRIIPPESILPFYRATAAVDKLLLTYEGDVGVGLQHLGGLVGRRAHAELWPALFDWMLTVGAPAAGSRRGKGAP